MNGVMAHSVPDSDPPPPTDHAYQALMVGLLKEMRDAARRTEAAVGQVTIAITRGFEELERRDSCNAKELHELRTWKSKVEEEEKKKLEAQVERRAAQDSERLWSIVRPLIMALVGAGIMWIVTHGGRQ